MRIAITQTILCVISLVFASGVQCQQLKVVADTDRYVEYSFVNDSLEIVHAYDFLIDSDNSASYDVVSQQIITRRIQSDPESKIIAYSLSSDQSPLFERLNNGVYRGQNKSNLVFHAAR